MNHHAAPHGEFFSPPTEDDYRSAWAVVRAIEIGATHSVPAANLARVIYAAERARKLLSGLPTCGERDQS